MNQQKTVKRIAAAMLALCLCFTGILSDVTSVKAEIDPNTFYTFGGSFYVSELSRAADQESYIYRCQLAWHMRFAVRFVVPEQTTVSVTVYAGESTSGAPVFQETLSAGSWLCDMNEGVYFSQANKELDAGTYTVKVSFGSAVPYYLAMAEEYDSEKDNTPSTTAHSGWYVGPAGAADSGGSTNSGGSTGSTDSGSSAGSGSPTIKNSQLAESSVSIVCGFQTTLKVLNPPDVPIIWESSNESVATVDSNGVVATKRKGNAVITARTEYDTGRLDKLFCYVTVVPNEYREDHTILVPKSLKKCKIQVYYAYFDNQGNLRMRCCAMNGTKKSVTGIRDLKIVLKDKNGKTIGTFSQKKKNLSILNGSSEDFEVKIKASAVKLKNADLTKAKYKATAKYQYKKK